MLKQQRPKFLNLLKIRLPVTGVTSILHRLSGVMLFVMIPLSLYLLQQSLHSPEKFQLVVRCVTSPIAFVVVLIVLWAFVHHLLAGFRFLLIDINIGMSLAAARKSAWLVLLLVPVVILYFIWKWWL